jgi:GTP:adenosylcobinamide-phosphate guanylyltransferase
MQTSFDVIVLAGYNPNKTEPLTEMTGQPHKALIEVDGRPMVWHVVRAVHESKRFDRVFISGLRAEDGVHFPCEVNYLPEQGSMVNNVLYSFQHLSTLQDNHRHAVLLSADIPLLSGDMINWFLDACQPNDRDVYWGLVEKTVMGATFPKSKRSYIRLVEGNYCSGDIFLGRISVATKNQKLIQDLANSRKDIFRQIRMLGWNALLRFVFRRLRFVDLLEITERNLGIKGVPVILPFAEMGMDVDKPHQLEQVKEYLQASPRSYPPTDETDI